MRLAIITYDSRHLKTSQVALRLIERQLELSFFALPFRQRKNREVLFAHRPDQMSGPWTSALAAYLKAPFVALQEAGEIPDDFDYYLIAGAPLLPPEFVKRARGRVINAHPGIIPIVRGLDSLKWAILDGAPLGNSLHFIDTQADAGEVIAIRRTPVFRTDELKDLATRHYEQEIDLLTHFDHYLGGHRAAVTLGEAVRPARLRMPQELEMQLDEAFQAYKEVHAV